MVFLWGAFVSAKVFRVVLHELRKGSWRPCQDFLHRVMDDGRRSSCALVSGQREEAFDGPRRISGASHPRPRHQYGSPDFHAAVDHDIDARDVRTLVRSQKQRDVRHFLRFADFLKAAMT